MSSCGWIYVSNGLGTFETAIAVSKALSFESPIPAEEEWFVLGPPSIWVNDVLPDDGLVDYDNLLTIADQTAGSYEAQDAAARSVYDRLLVELPWRIALAGDDGQAIIAERLAVEPGAS